MQTKWMVKQEKWNKNKTIISDCARKSFFKLPIFRVKFIYLLKPSVSKLKSNMTFLEKHNNLFGFVLSPPKFSVFSHRFFLLCMVFGHFQAFLGLFEPIFHIFKNFYPAKTVFYSRAICLREITVAKKSRRWKVGSQ